MKISLIAALARNRVIGTGTGGLPWDLPRDRRHFRSRTEGRHMLLGRITFEEMEGWFTNQKPLVLSHRSEFRPAVGRRVSGIEEGITAAREAGETELMVSGGATVYAAALPYADELVLTFIHANIAGSVQFPQWEDAGPWEEVSRQDFPADHENEYPMSIVELRRAGKGSTFSRI